jgi:hypothetical protein
MKTVHRWRCLECDAGGEGTAAGVQRAADNHTTKPPKHGTVAGTEVKR